MENSKTGQYGLHNTAISGLHNVGFLGHNIGLNNPVKFCKKKFAYRLDYLNPYGERLAGK